MFGMLDYRAYKLMWLVFLPWRWGVVIVGYLAAIASAFLVHAFLLHYHYLLQLLVAVVGFEVLFGIPFALVTLGVEHLLKKGFFWVIDVVPAHGTSVEEAKAIAMQGPAYELGMKFDRHIDEWTDEDTERFLALLNWRARWFFPAAARMRFTIEKLRETYESTGKQPFELGQKEVENLRDGFSGGKLGVLERFFVSPIGFHVALRCLVMALTLILLR